MCVYVYVYMCVYTCIIYNLIGVCGAQQSTHTRFDRRLARTPVQRTKILVPSATRVCVCVCVRRQASCAQQASERAMETEVKKDIEVKKETEVKKDALAYTNPY